MYCKNCGQQIPDGIYYCEHCGAEINQGYTQQPFHTDHQNNGQTYQQSNQQYNPYAQPYNPQAFEYMINTKIDDAKTYGILAIIAGLFIPIFGIILGIIGINKLNDIPLSVQFRYETELKKKKAKNLCIAGIAVPIVIWVIGLIFVFFVWGMILNAMW